MTKQNLGITLVSNVPDIYKENHTTLEIWNKTWLNRDAYQVLE